MDGQRRRVRPYPAVAPGYRGPSRRDLAGSGWELAVCGDLGDKQMDLMSRLVELPRNSRGTIFFDSSGGSVYVGLGLATLIRLRGVEVDGVVVGECSSAALLPFAACSRRFVTPHSTLLFHPIRWQTDEDVRFEEAEEWARHFRVLEQDLDRLLAQLFGCDPKLIRKWNRPGRFVGGAEFVEQGLAQMIDLFSGELSRQIGQNG